jgi:hypothetical protein
MELPIKVGYPDHPETPQVLGVTPLLRRPQPAVVPFVAAADATDQLSEQGTPLDAAAAVALELDTYFTGVIKFQECLRSRKDDRIRRYTTTNSCVASPLRNTMNDGNLKPNQLLHTSYTSTANVKEYSGTVRTVFKIKLKRRTNGEIAMWRQHQQPRA